MYDMSINELELQMKATIHAKKILGMDHFVENEDAAGSIIEDFKDGFKECVLCREETTEARLHEATKMFNEYSANPELYDNDFNKLLWRIVSL